MVDQLSIQGCGRLHHPLPGSSPCRRACSAKNRWIGCNHAAFRKHWTLLILIVLVALTPSHGYFRVGSLIFAINVRLLALSFSPDMLAISLGHAGFAGIGAYTCALGPRSSRHSPGAGRRVERHFRRAGLAGRPPDPASEELLFWLQAWPWHSGLHAPEFTSDIAVWTASMCQTPACAISSAMGLGFSATEAWYVFNGFMLIVGAWLALNLGDSPTGRALRALHSESPRAPCGRGASCRQRS